MDNSMLLAKGMARDLLSCLSVSPTTRQLDLAVSFISNVIFDGKFVVDRRLARKEISCLYWASQGKSAEETASLLCLSKATVETYRSRIKKKLNCRNMTQAVYKGMKYAYVLPSDSSDSKDPYI